MTTSCRARLDITKKIHYSICLGRGEILHFDREPHLAVVIFPYHRKSWDDVPKLISSISGEGSSDLKVIVGTQ